MHTDYRLRRSTVRLVLGAMLAWIICAVILAPAFAQAPAITPGYTACGAMATGKDRTQGGAVVTAALARQFVGPDGYWHTCQPWVADGGDPATPEPAAPKADCAAVPPPITWQVDARMCTSYLQTPAMRHDGLAVALAEVGNTRGLALLRCRDGVASIEPGATCAWATHCDRDVTVYGGPLNAYRVTVQAAARPRPNGTTLRDVRGTDGAGGVVRATLQCAGGVWVVQAWRRGRP